ncbi:MAG: PspC domain-containing protein, partial [Gemmatimonadetes bacterium]|nr:PspC domain-containing protein [Gemmatimonadota bacterium]
MKRLVRSRDEKILFGVCGGVAEYFGIDANIVRLVWILSVLLGGFGLIPYVAAIFLLPEEDTATSAGSSPGTPAAPATRIFGLVLMGLGALLLFRAFGLEFRSHTFRFWHFEVLAPIVLLGAGALLIWPRTRSALGFGSERKARRSVTDRVIAGVC